jgi:hypothetical protein
MHAQQADGRNTKTHKPQKKQKRATATHHMPRDYLKRYSRTVGRHRSRGGHGRNHLEDKPFPRFQNWDKYNCPYDRRHRANRNVPRARRRDDQYYNNDDNDNEHEHEYNTVFYDWYGEDDDDDESETTSLSGAPPATETFATKSMTILPTEQPPPHVVVTWTNDDDDDDEHGDILLDDDNNDDDTFDGAAVETQAGGFTFVDLPQHNPYPTKAVGSSTSSGTAISYSLCGNSTTNIDATNGDRFSFSAVSVTSMANNSHDEDSSSVRINDDHSSSVMVSSTTWEFVVTDALLGFENSDLIKPKRGRGDADGSGASAIHHEKDSNEHRAKAALVVAPNNNIAHTQKDLLSKCAICWERPPSPIIIKPLMRQCHHPAACTACLRSYYMDHQIKNVANFPLHCFWPGCPRIVGDTQMRQIVSNDGSAMADYFRQKSILREARRETRRLAAEEAENARLLKRAAKLEAQLEAQKRIEQEAKDRQLVEWRIWNLRWREQCDECGTTQPVHPGRSSWQQTTNNYQHYACCHCHQSQRMTLSYNDVQSIVAATGADLVNCPSCLTLIARDGGCNRMFCTQCQTNFSFEHAQALISQKPVPAKQVRRR